MSESLFGATTPINEMTLLITRTLSSWTRYDANTDRIRVKKMERIIIATSLWRDVVVVVVNLSTLSVIMTLRIKTSL
jgi:hypothetical protein